jgi:hypothetical protein
MTLKTPLLAAGPAALRSGGRGNYPYCLRVSCRQGNPPDKISIF